jgi:3-deoxy-D-manno-octulosonic-acid transferase
MTHPLLALYRCAWLVALPPIAALDRLDGRLRGIAGRGLLPRTWRVTERICYPGAGIRRSAPSAESTPSSSAVPPRRALWLHCASLGEAKGLWAFALSLTEAPDLALTAATADGAAWLEARCAEASDGLAPERRITAGIAPLDHPGVLRRFLDAHGALGLCLYEAELWPNALAACRERGLPVALVSGRLTVRAQRRYLRFGRAGARLLDGLAWIQAQSPKDRERFASLTRTEVFDGCDFKAIHYLSSAPMSLVAPSPPPAQAPEAPRARPRFAFLSLHYRELLRLLPALPALMERTPLIVFPRKMRELDRFRAILEPLHFRLHSRDAGARHVLVDSMGRIGDLLPSCHSAFVGGSLVRLGCHNLWEPLLAGCRIHFGPEYQAQESLADRILERGLGSVLKDPKRIGSLPFPGPEVPGACGDLVRELLQGLDSALLEGGRRIFATFYPQANAGHDGGGTALAAGKDKGYQR